MVGFSWEEALQLVVRGLWRNNTIGEGPTGCWWCRKRKCSLAKVFFAHVVPQGLCENLINAVNWRAPNRLLVVQTGESASLAKVFFAHAVPQGLCENLINAVNLVAN